MEDIQRSRFRKIGVFCGSDTVCREVFRDAAIELGEELVKRKIDLVYEGRSDGLMGLISRIVYDAGFHVFRFIPRALKRGETLGDVSVIADMHERKAAMAKEAEAFIALPGGYETMEELLEMIKWSQLSIHNKMVGIVNVDGYYDDLLSLFVTGVKEGFIKSHSRIVVSAPTAKELMEKMEIIEDVTFTWRNIPPFLLSTVMLQCKDICWAIAFIRQLEFCMKLNKLLPVEEHLSVQELINITPHNLRHQNGAIWEINPVLTVLKERGTVLERYRPFTEFLGRGHKYFDEEPLIRYRPQKVNVYCIDDQEYHGSYKDFHDDLCKSLQKDGCLSIRIPMCRSYINLKHKDIYNPSQEELDEARYSGCGPLLLAVGCGYDLNGDLFYECQDSGGVTWGDEGYIRVSAKIVTHYVKMLVYEVME